MTEHKKRPQHGHTNHSTSRPQGKRPEGVFGNLIPDVQRAVASQKYVTPTPIQEQCIPLLLEGRDLMGCAQTGTGKTAAFALPMLQKLSSEGHRHGKGTPRALILAPTRELAAQIGESFNTYGHFLRLRHIVIFGGVNQFHQVKGLNKGIDILVATPGRLLDLIQQGHIHLERVEIFVLDEVDRMLDMGFIPDIKRVIALIPKKRQTLFFSATMPPRMVKLAETMVHNPVRVTITPDKPAVESITQKVLFVGKKKKDSLLASLLGDAAMNKALVFTQMKHVANRVVTKLCVAGIKSTAIHGNKSQGARTKALDGFKRGQYRVLVATDVAARGLDVDDITHVINYDMPREAETYVHRIGRTARAGADGDAISFCCAEERCNLNAIERLLGQPIPIELEHAYHSEEAYLASGNEPQKSARGSGGGRGRRPKGRSPSYRSKGSGRGKRPVGAKNLNRRPRR